MSDGQKEYMTTFFMDSDDREAFECGWIKAIAITIVMGAFVSFALIMLLPTMGALALVGFATGFGWCLWPKIQMERRHKKLVSGDYSTDEIKKWSKGKITQRVRISSMRD